MSKELLNQALEYLEDNQHWVADGERHAYVMEYNAFIDKLKQALAQQEPVAVYGYCPQCGAKGVMRERRPNGNDKCANGHTYPSSTSTPPQRTWVDLTEQQMNELWANSGTIAGYNGLTFENIRAVSAKLKENNT